MAATDGKDTAATQNIANLNQYGAGLATFAHDTYIEELMGRINDQQQLDNYDQYVAQQLLQQQNEIDIFDRQLESYNSGMEYVEMAKETALDREFLAYQQALMGHESDFANMQRQNDRAQLQAGYSTNNLNLQLDNNRIDFSNQQISNRLQGLSNQNMRLDASNQALANRNMQFDVTNQMLANRNISNQIASQRLDSQNILNQIANQQLDYNNLDLQIGNNNLQRKQIGNNIASIQRDANIIRNSLASNVIDGQELERQSQRLRIEDQNRQQQFGVQMQEQALQIQKQASDSNLAMLQETLKGQATAAKSNASGKRGNSAKAMMQAATALTAINQGAISDGLRRGTLNFKNAVTGLTSQEKASKALYEVNQQSISGQKEQNLLSRDSIKQSLEQNKLKIKNLRLDDQSVVNNNAMLRNNQEAIANNIQSSINNLEQNQLNISSSMNNLAQGQNALQQKKNNVKQGQNTLQQKQNNIRQGEMQLEQGQNNLAKLNNDAASIQNNIDEVAALLGLTQEQFEADSETLNQMMLDELGAYENVVERINNAAFKDETNLFNNMPLPPTFLPLAEPPYDIDDPERMDPTLVEPVFHDSDAYAIEQPSTDGGSGLGGSIGAILGMAVGAALAIPTGGMSVPGAWAAVGGGATLGGSIGGGLGNVVDAFSY